MPKRFQAKRGSESWSNKRVYTGALRVKFGSGGEEQADLYRKSMSFQDAMLWNSLLQQYFYENGDKPLRGGDVERAYWLKFLHKTPEEYQKFLSSLD